MASMRTIQKQWLGYYLAAIVLLLVTLVGCGGVGKVIAPVAPTAAPLDAGNINLIFVVSEDLAYQAGGDVSPSTANLTNRGLQRSLRMATFLQQNVLGGENVNGIYAVEPMTHLQTTNTANSYPDLAALETVQQFAMLNQLTFSSTIVGPTQYTANSFPINAGYAMGQTLSEVAAPGIYCESCKGSTMAMRMATTNFY